MSLDKRLKDAIRAYGAEIDPHGYDDGDEDKAIDAIKQAFIDEGWVQIPQITVGKHTESQMGDVFRVNNKVMMTGPEWLARFEKECQKEVLDGGYVYLQAARRAAGVSDE